MHTQYHISISIKKPSGFEQIGHFQLGTDGRFADEIFTLLSGRRRDDTRQTLFMELSSSIGGAQLPIAIKYCSLSDLTHNVQLIARELFKRHAL